LDSCWCSDPNGYLIVTEHYNDENNNVYERSSTIIAAAVSHVYLCLNKNRVWIEGVIVRPNYRGRSMDPPQ